LQIKKCRQSVPAHDEQMLQNTFWSYLLRTKWPRFE
jgi:hypothetical protein